MSYDPQSLRPSSSPAPWLLLLVTVAGAGSGAWWLNQDRQKARTDAGAATLKAAEATAAQKELTQKVEALESDKTALASEKTALAADKAELSKDVAAKSGELAELKGTYDKLQEKMKDGDRQGRHQLTQSGGKLRVGLVDKILFDSGEAQISKRGEGVLRAWARCWPRSRTSRSRSPATPTTRPSRDKLATQFPTNWELSTARATNVVRFLAEKASVPAERLVASGYGEFHPIASNKTPAGRARNRRIEILLTPSLAPKAIASKATPSKPAPSKPAPSKPTQRVAHNGKPGKK